MTVRGTAAVAAAILFAIAFTPIATKAKADANPVPSRPISWLAAGDSYSSGEGLPHATGSCAQAHDDGSKSWAQEAHDLLAASSKITTSRFDFVACTGARSSQFFAAQGPNEAEWDGTHRYDLITFTFGGDDVNFPNFMTDCLLIACPPDQAARDDIRTLGNSYRSFLIKVANQASVTGGDILVLGYPELIEDPNQWTGLPQFTDLCQGLGRNQAAEIRGLGGALNQAIGNAVSIVNGQHPNGVTIRFLDVNSGGSLGISRDDPRLFEPSIGARHNVCSSDAWMNGLSTVDGRHLPWNGILKGSFHPKQQGLDSEANLVEQVLTSQMDWSATRPSNPQPSPVRTSLAAVNPGAPSAQAPPTTAVHSQPTTQTGSPTTSVHSEPTTQPAPPATTATPPVDPTGIISYNEMRGGAPYYGRSPLGWQSFTAGSNTITQIGVTWSNPADTPGQPVSGANTRISLCTGVGDPASADPCQGRIADTSVTVLNQGESTANVGDVAVNPGTTYYVFYYQPAYQAGQWDLYWWRCPSNRCVTGRNPNAKFSDQNQIVVRGFNR